LPERLSGDDPCREQDLEQDGCTGIGNVLEAADPGIVLLIMAAAA
jgi:hypothetical protein